MAANGMRMDLRYLRAEKIAGSVGLKEEHDLHYRFLSKFAHASSVTVLTRGGDNWKQLIAPILCFTGAMQYLQLFASINDAMFEQRLPTD